MKKILSVILCALLVFSAISFNIMGVVAEDASSTIQDGGILDFSELKGNSIRSSSDNSAQGLRFKYTVNESVDIGDYEIEEIGVLAIRTALLDGGELTKATAKAGKGVFYNSTDEIDNIADDGVVSAVLINIGYNKTTNELDFSAYAEEYTARLYMILSAGDTQITVYDNADTACVIDVMKTIVDSYGAENPAEGTQLYEDYQSVNTILDSTAVDKNNKTVKQIYEKRYPTSSSDDEDEGWTGDYIINTGPR